MLRPTEEERRLLAHADELLGRARAGEITCTSYLTPREQALLAAHFAAAPGEWEADGGYPEAERARMFFLPEYVQETDGALRIELLAPTKAEQLAALCITGSGYRELAHRDYLGAVLSLGIRREALGDLCVSSPHEAVLFADRVLADFLCGALTHVANDIVRVRHFELPPGFDGGRRLLPGSDTVPSPRADAVVAAICNLSRERAQALFREGRVEIGYEPQEKPDRPVQAGEVVVIRGFGKFVIRSLAEKTKKGRYRLLCDRYL